MGIPGGATGVACYGSIIQADVLVCKNFQFCIDLGAEGDLLQCV